MPSSFNTSDPIEFQCSCPGSYAPSSKIKNEKNQKLPANQTGKVLLFYNYISVREPNQLAEFLKETSLKLDIRGKIRVALEGFNVTLGGSFNAIVEFVSIILKNDFIHATRDAKDHHFLFKGIEKLIQKDQDLFQEVYDALQCTNAKQAEMDLSPLGKFIYFYFKPSEGCQHVFEKLSVTVLRDGRLFEGIRSELLAIPCTSEQISDFTVRQNKSVTLSFCENGLLDKENQKKDKVLSLLPNDFHHHLLNELDKKDTLLLDCRNYYEMKIGHFKNSILPPIRKYSLFPKYLEKNKDMFKGKKVFTYCTGGVRCETAAPLISAQTEASQVIMLQGGIHNYLDYIASHNLESLFTGVNYVFDARQSLGSPSSFCSTCVQCDNICVEYTKCQCHSIIICCRDCVTLSKIEGFQIYCCNDCADGIKPCLCERERGIALGL